MSDPTESGSADTARDHLENVPDGCGCAEVWETLSAERGPDDAEDA